MADLEPEEKAGFDVCIPTPGVPMGERLMGPASNWLPLCTPTYPCNKKAKAPPFFGKDEKLPLFVTIIMGLQHMLAMLGGMITPPKLIANDGCVLGRDPDICGKMPYLISATLIASGLLTLVQVFRLKLVGGYYLGTGLISVMGPSFAFLPIARSLVQDAINDPDGETLKAYGDFLGTCLVASLVEIFISFIPPKILRKLCPPVVSGTTVFLIGTALTATGIKYWGGGVFCAENIMSRPMAAAAVGNRFIAGPQSCQGDNGGSALSDGEEHSPGHAPYGFVGVDLPYGSSQFLGLGFVVIVFFLFFEMFGPPFVKNCNIALSLLLGYAVAAGCTYETDDGVIQRFVTGQFMETTDWGTFLWVETFPLGFSSKAFVPLIIAFFVSSAESVGDITASCDVSQIPSSGPVADSRVQGGLLADGINSLVAALMTTPPNTTFSQNNGVIGITRCASRLAGYACAGWCIFFGVLGKFGGFIADIPSCTLGGMATILFASVLVSGIAVLQKVPMTRRNRIILACSLGFGLGVSAVPEFIVGGGPASFYGHWLNMNMGPWPLKECCKDGTRQYFNGGYDGVNNTDSFDPTYNLFGSIPGERGVGPSGGDIGSVLPTTLAGNGLTYSFSVAPSTWVLTCEIDDAKKAWREAILLTLKTPYSIGFIIAMILNLILPADPEEETKETVKEMPAEPASVTSASSA